MSFNSTDIFVIISYFALILFTGYYLSRKWESKGSSGFDEYLLAGRKVTLPLFVATLVATWYGNILGMGEFVYSKGIVAFTCFAFPYYIAAVLFAYFLAKKIRLSEARTIPEHIKNNYGETAGKISSYLILIITIPAAYFLMLGVLIQLFTGWNLWLCVVIGAGLSLGYIYTGGLKADILTNTAQFVIMYLGFGSLLFFAIYTYGMPGEAFSRLPEEHLKLGGGNSWQYILVWFVIALQTFIDPSFHQRSAAAKTPAIAQKGVLISIVCWVVFDTLTILSGLYAKAFVHIDNAIMAFPAIGDAVLPHFWKGLFVTSMLATVMSTLDSYAFISAATFGNDIFKKLEARSRKSEEDYRKRLLRYGLIITGIVGIGMAAIVPSAVGLVYKTASITVPALLIPMIVSFSKIYYIGQKQTVIIMFVSSLVSGFFTVYSILEDYSVNLKWQLISGIEPMLPGILVSVILGSIFIRKMRVKN